MRIETTPIAGGSVLTGRTASRLRRDGALCLRVHAREVAARRPAWQKTSGTSDSHFSFGSPPGADRAAASRRSARTVDRPARSPRPTGNAGRRRTAPGRAAAARARLLLPVRRLGPRLPDRLDPRVRLRLRNLRAGRGHGARRLHGRARPRRGRGRRLSPRVRRPVLLYGMPRARDRPRGPRGALRDARGDGALRPASAGAARRRRSAG